MRRLRQLAQRAERLKRAQLEAEVSSLRQALRESRAALRRRATYLVPRKNNPGAHGEYQRLSTERHALALRIHDQPSARQQLT